MASDHCAPVLAPGTHLATDAARPWRQFVLATPLIPSALASCGYDHSSVSVNRRPDGSPRLRRWTDE
jgi:hypothetical protein